MALSKSPIPFEAQHYLVCDTEDCEKNCQFYCNDCHQKKCEQCRDEHQKSPETKKHEVVSYKQRKRELPVEKCKIHEIKDIDLLCAECQIDLLFEEFQIPLCSKCKDTIEHCGPVSEKYITKPKVKQTLSLSFSVTKVREYKVPDVDRVCHISMDKSGRVWVSDSWGILVQTDQQGNRLQKIETNYEPVYHTVTQDGDLIYTYSDNKVINRITPDNTITEFIKTGDWGPLSIHSSHINGDILVGMKSKGKSKIIRYNDTGKEIQNIQRDNEGQELYIEPEYITENINGDICVSDYNKEAVVVVDKSGQHRFSYTGQGSMFRPLGICTDVLGHILLCNGISETVHLLDQDGQFLFLLLTFDEGVYHPFSLCVDDENNIHVGQRSDKVRVYKYLQ